jgi:site-specific DNA-methyltransferase (adenine-specific)
MKHKIYLGDCLEVMKTLPSASVDAVCTDPPYGLEFMGKDWDSFKQGRILQEARQE